ncbi:MAG: dockerin type I domain-containing protein [Candidatus Bathyarchaeia archaeon]
MKTKVIVGVMLTLFLVSMLSTVMPVSAGGYVGPEDVNGDGSVNLQDIIIAIQAFGSTPASANWDQRADINGDNLVDIFDLVRIAIKYGADP